MPHPESNIITSPNHTSELEDIIGHHSIVDPFGNSNPNFEGFLLGARRVASLGIQIPMERIYSLVPRMPNMDIMPVLHAYRNQPECLHSPAIKYTVTLITQLMNDFQSQLSDTVKILEDIFTVGIEMERVVASCHVLNYYSRLIFYRSCIEGWPKDLLDMSLVRAKSELNLPSNFDVRQKLRQIMNSLEDQLYVEHIFLAENRSARLGREDNGGVPPIEDLTENLTANVSADADADADADTEAATKVEAEGDGHDNDDDKPECSICFTTETTEVVRTVACKHTFCKDCLEKWMNADQANCHRCPTCRTELFPRAQQHNDGPGTQHIYINYLLNMLEETKSGMESAFWLLVDIAMERCREEQ